MAPTTLSDTNKEYDRWVKDSVLSPGDSEITWNKGGQTAAGVGYAIEWSFDSHL